MNVTWLDFNSAPIQGEHEPAPDPVWTQPETYDRDEVKASLLRQLESVLGYLYPKGFSDPKGRTFYIGDVHGSEGESLNVVLTGERAGLWHDFATAEGGDIFDLWQAARGLPSFRETIRDAALYSGAASSTPKRMPKRKQPAGGDAWGVPVATYRYTDANGSIVAEVDRFEWVTDKGEKKKAFRPWDVTTRRHRAPESRPLYNLPNIISAPEIIVVEGEKAADALIAQNIDATTAMGGASAPLEKTDWSVMRGRSVVIWPDNDAAGKAYAERLKTYLETEVGAGGVTILNIPANRPEKWDAADAETEDLGALIKAMRPASVEGGVSFSIEFWDDVDLAAIPRVEYVYNRFYARGYTSVTAAPPKVGKSLLGLVEAVDIATGRGILTGVPQAPQRVYYYNAEDDLNTIRNRVGAILKHYGIDQSEIRGRLALHSGIGTDGFYIISGQEGQINEAQFQAMEAAFLEHGIDCAILDPVQDLSRSPETNEVFRLLGGRLRAMANRCRLAIGLIHHTRKMQPGVKASIDDMRGGSALRGTARFNRLLVPMSEDDAVKAGLQDHRSHFQIGDIEGNLAPPSSDYAKWFEKISVTADNGESVGVVVPWQWPDAFDGITPQDARRVQLAIGQMEDDPPRANAQSKSWAGYVVASVLGMDADDKNDRSRISALIKTWLKTGVLDLVEVRDTRAGRDVKAILPGPNVPTEVE